MKKKTSIKKRNFTVQIKQDLFDKAKDKAKKNDIRLRAIVEKAFQDFIDN